MTFEDQQEVIKVMGRQVAGLSVGFVESATSKFLTTVDSILADPDMSQIEKFAAIKTIMDEGWRRIVAVTHGDPNLTVGQLAAREVTSELFTGDKGMDDAILDLMGLERKGTK